jgi:hypothetical protein
VIPAALFVAGFLCLAGTALLLRSLGSRYRVGRLIAAAPEITIEEARDRATHAPAVSGYVRLAGRISSDEEFPDENDRPLVYRRKRLEVAAGDGQWRVISDEREAVPFGIEARSSFIAVDETAIEHGLVAVPREAAGTVGELPSDVQADFQDELTGLAPETPARLVIEQLSAVEHATVCGVPIMRGTEPALSAGHGRPLIVTTLAPEEAMRLLAASHRGRVQAAAGLLALGILLAVAALVSVLAGL